MKVPGNLRQRKTGTWQFRRTFGNHADGRQRVRSADFGDKSWSYTRAQKEAKRISDQWEALELAEAEAETSVGKFARDWLTKRANDVGRRRLSPNQAYRYESIVARIDADLGRIQLAALTPRDLDHWYVALGQPRVGKRDLSPNTVLYYHKVLHAILEQAFRWELITRNPADKSTPPMADEVDESARMPTMAAIELMLGKASRSVKMAVLLGSATGCRRAELVGLLWSDIDADGLLTVQRSLYKDADGKLAVKTTKTGKTRQIPLNPALLAELVRFRAENVDFARRAGGQLADDGPILAHLRKDATGRTPFQPDWLSQEWERLCKRAGVAPFKLHGLRHLHVTALHDAGVATALIQARTGHASAQTVERHYLHTIPAAELEVGRTVVEDVFSSLFADRAPI